MIISPVQVRRMLRTLTPVLLTFIPLLPIHYGQGDVLLICGSVKNLRKVTTPSLPSIQEGPTFPRLAGVQFACIAALHSRS